MQVALIALLLISGVLSQCNPACGPGLCCSKWGFCGSGDAYCNTPAPPVPTGGVPTNVVDPNTCNPPCGPGFCCSKWGFCGSGSAWCGQNNDTKPLPPPPKPTSGNDTKPTGPLPPPPKPTSRNDTRPTDTPRPPTHIKPTSINNTSPHPPPNPSKKLQIAAYWGQDTIGIHDANNLQKNIDHYCNDENDILVVSFLITFFGSSKEGQTSLPEINLANSCGKTFDKYPTLLNCPDVGDAIKKCQAKGKKIILSLGGASGSYGFTNAAQPAQFAATIWEMFLGGSSTLPRPFGDAVMDGIDLDIEGGSPLHYDTFVKIMREKYFDTAPRKYYITGAPQCPFPDAYVGAALDTGYFDYAFVQFYNNWCGVSNFNNPNAWNWKTWEDFAAKHPNTKVFLGVPAATYAANAGSYVEPAVVGQIVQSIKNSPAFGGIMIWDATVADANGFGKAVAPFLR